MHKIWQVLPEKMDDDESDFETAKIRVKCYTPIKSDEKNMGGDEQNSEDIRGFKEDYGEVEDANLLSARVMRRRSLDITLPTHYHLPKPSEDRAEDSKSQVVSCCKRCNEPFTDIFAIVESKIIEQKEEKILNFNKYFTKRYRCTVCGDMTSDSVAMKEHVLDHTKAHEVICDQCEIKGDEWRNYVYRCVNCDIVIDDVDHVISKILEKYIEENNKKDKRQTYLCLVCSIRTTDEDDIKEHVLGNHIMNAIPCKECEIKEQTSQKDGKNVKKIRSPFPFKLFD